MNMTFGNLLKALLVTSFTFIGAPVLAQQNTASTGDVLMRALNDEMTRAMDELRLDEQRAPYFIAYQVIQKTDLAMEARGDALSKVEQNTERRLNVEVRVGTPQADSSRVVRFGGNSRAFGLADDGSAPLPLDDNYDALRQRIWIATDVAYKRALEDMATREAAASVSETKGKDLPDQLPVPALQAEEDHGEALLDADEAALRLRAVAATLAQEPGLEQSFVWLDADETQVWYVTSEGTSTWQRIPSASLGMAAATRAEDGEPLLDYRHYRARQTAGLPSASMLVDDARELGERLAALRAVPPLGEFNGPVLFRGEAAAQLLAERFVNHLAPLPRHYASQPPMQTLIDQLAEQNANFSRRLGARVMTTDIELVDDPTLQEWQGQPLLSASAFDSEGVATRRKVLVEDGRLKTLLSTRAPAVARDVTPGNQRGMFADVATLIMRSKDGLDEADLQAEMVSLLDNDPKAFALEVERFADVMVERRLEQTSFTIYLTGSEPKLPRPVRINKVYADGRREPTRGVLLADIGNREFRTLAAVGKTPSLVVRETAPSAYLNFFSQRNAVVLPSSYLVPDLLFEDLSASEDSRQIRRRAILPKPSHTGMERQDR